MDKTQSQQPNGNDVKKENSKRKNPKRKEENFIQQTLTIFYNQSRDVIGQKHHYNLSSLNPQIYSSETQQEMLNIMEQFFDTKSSVLLPKNVPSMDYRDQIFFTYNHSNYFVVLEKKSLSTNKQGIMAGKTDRISGFNLKLIEEPPQNKLKRFTIRVPAHGLVHPYKITLLRDESISIDETNMPILMQPSFKQPSYSITGDMLELIENSFSLDLIRLICKHNKKLYTYKIKKDCQNLITANTIRTQESDLKDLLVLSELIINIEEQRKIRNQAVTTFIDVFLDFCSQNKEKTVQVFSTNKAYSDYLKDLFSYLRNNKTRSDFQKEIEKYDNTQKVGIYTIKEILQKEIEYFNHDKGYYNRSVSRLWFDINGKEAGGLLSFPYLFKILKADIEDNYRCDPIDPEIIDREAPYYKYKYRNAVHDKKYHDILFEYLRNNQKYRQMIEIGKVFTREDKELKKRISLLTLEERKIKKAKERKIVESLIELDENEILDSLSWF